jgi:hypothetical protein
MSWQSFLDANYSHLEYALQHAKVITRYYELTVLDIAGLDLMRLVYDDGAYFLINRVVDFRPGLTTKVELFKVS